MQVKLCTHSLHSGWSAGALDDSGELDGKSTLIIVFGAPEYRDHPQALAELDAAFPQALKAGCSTAGEIFGVSVSDASLAVAILRFEQSAIRVATAATSIEASYESGRRLGDALADKALRSVFVLSEGLQVNGSALVEGIEDGLNRNGIVSGGLSADGDRFASTWTWQGGAPRSGQVVAVGFYGAALAVSYGSYGGWRPFGPERLVTRAHASTLYELDGLPALDLYKRYLGEYANELPSSGLLFPLALRSKRGDDGPIVRTILSIDEASNSITFAGSIPEGSYAQLMTANFDQLIDGAHVAADQIGAIPGDGGEQGILIGVSCVGRRLLLGERAEEELEAVAESFRALPRFIGFYSYGEIAPNLSSVGCSLKNQTMTLTFLNEVCERASCTRP